MTPTYGYMHSFDRPKLCSHKNYHAVCTLGSTTGWAFYFIDDLEYNIGFWLVNIKQGAWMPWLNILVGSSSECEKRTIIPNLRSGQYIKRCVVQHISPRVPSI
jgi:hypothetical protein